ncbi:MAG TPA: hypothetical protein VFQ95_02725 [Rhodanobacteraceae bacterium]|nr:hypothetical protein [Rhodanobacteraceae bacterium]
MNATKPVAAIAAMLISFAGIGAITHYSNAAANAARADIHAVDANRPVTTLPAIEVVPSSAQLRELSQPGGGAAATTGAQMPYYSFAAEQVSA